MFVFAYLLISSGLKVKKLFKNKFENKYADYQNYKMDIKSLKIETKTNYNWDDMVYIYDFDVNLVKIIKRKSKFGVDIYYIGYMYNPKNKFNTIKPFYITINRLLGHVEKIEGSSNRYLIVNEDNYKINNIFKKMWKYIENRITAVGIWQFLEKEIIFDNEDNKIKEYNKLRFSSDIDLPLDKIIYFRTLTINISFIKKDNK